MSDDFYKSIGEVGSGDYVKVRNEYKKISRIDKTCHPDFPNSPTPRSWTITTEDGETVSMYEARSYHKKEDIEKEKSKNF